MGGVDEGQGKTCTSLPCCVKKALRGRDPQLPALIPALLRYITVKVDYLNNKGKVVKGLNAPHRANP